MLVRSSSIRSGLEEARSIEKIPLFVPSQIIKPSVGRLMIPEHQSSRLSPDAALRVGDAAQDGHANGQENNSKEALSEASDWSTTVQFEAPKQEVFRSKSEVSIAPDSNSSIKQESWPDGSESQEVRKDAEGRFSLSNPNAIKSVAGSETGAAYTNHGGWRAFKSCSAYFQRLKQHLRASFTAEANNNGEC